MKDLKIKYEHNGETFQKEYDCIFDLNDAIKNNEDAPPLDGTNVEAIFFENELHKKKFETIEKLAEHCKKICR